MQPLQIRAAGVTVCCIAALACGQLVDSSFVYQGRLTDGGQPANGSYDFEFSLYDAESDGIEVGSAGPFLNQSVTGGLFTVTLDFGDGVFTGEQRYLEMRVRVAGGGGYTTLAPRTPVKAAPYARALPGVRTDVSGVPSVVGGALDNAVTGTAATIAGGEGNVVSSDHGAIGGGEANSAAQQAVVGGGTLNGASGFRAVVSGGHSNSAQAQHSTIGGGLNNDVQGLNGTVCGGTDNQADGERAAVGGGGFNEARAYSATVGGGSSNEALDNYGTVSGGNGNIAGSDDGNATNEPFATVGGGSGNTASGVASTVSGGSDNSALGGNSTVAGGNLNVASNALATVAGGNGNMASGDSSFVAGGQGNTASGIYAAVGGGLNNDASNNASAVAGGSANTASGNSAIVAGGALNQATGDQSAVLGGSLNIAGGDLSTVAGGAVNSAGGDWSFAAGQGAVVRDAAASGDSNGDEGTFVWADSAGGTFTSTGPNQFLVEASGGMGINVNSPSATLDVTTSGAGRVLEVTRAADSVSGANLLSLESGAGSSAASQLIEAKRGTDIEFRVDGDGDVLADGTYAGPADFAEMIKVSTGAASAEAGDVLVIDADRPRAVLISTAARSTLVAGVYSTNPGYLGSEHDWDDVVDELKNSHSIGPAGKPLELGRLLDEVPLAVVGIVPCKVTTENGPIAPGDLLVTSSVPGHAMRDDAPRAGTIVGKALGRLDGGTGVIKILVTLQ